MVEEGFKRILTAILSTDVVSYSRLAMKRVKSWSSYLGLATIIFIGIVEPVFAQTTEPILRVEVGTHNASIFGIAMDPSNRILVTGSEDKTVRVWDISSDVRLLRIIRPPVGEGEQGQIFTVALSPDGRTIACGGRTGSPKQGDGCIYLFDRDTGAITRRIGGLPGWVQDLEYTGDGRFLADSNTLMSRSSAAAERDIHSDSTVSIRVLLPAW